MKFTIHFVISKHPLFGLNKAAATTAQIQGAVTAVFQLSN
jgi:hypothetical protein